MSVAVSRNDNRGKPGVLAVIHDDLQKPSGVQKIVLMPAIRALSWADWYKGISAPALRAKGLLSNANRMLFWFDFPKGIKNLFKAFREFKESVSAGAPLEIGKKTSWVFVRSTEVSGLVSSGFDIAHKEGFINLSARSLAIIDTIGFLGSAALFFNAVVGIKKELTKLEAAEYLSPKYKLAFSQVIAKTLLAVMGVFGMATFALGSAAIAQWLFLSVTTAFLALSILNHFYEEVVVKPEEKTLELKA